jgi:predicted  nucleic acid-binding Zn-ribbon protein
MRDAKDRESDYRKDLQQEERRIATLDEQMKQSESFIEQQEAELNERRAQAESDMSEKKHLVEELRKNEEKITGEMDKELLFKFDRIIRNKKGKGIVPMRGGVCSGCHMILPAQFANDVREGEQIVFCPYCSRILYYEDAAEVADLAFDTESVGSLTDLDDLEDETDGDDDDDGDSVMEDEGGMNFDD